MSRAKQRRQDPFELLKHETAPFLIGNRTPSVALLAWFLQTVWRLEPEEVDDSICDGGGDKGIDALVLDPDAQEIVIFQVKHRLTAGASQGDADLRAFLGTAVYFHDAPALRQLISSQPPPRRELLSLLQRNEVPSRLDEGNYTLRMVFVTNALADPSAVTYVSSLERKLPPLEFWYRDRLAKVALRTQSPGLLPDVVELTAAGEHIVTDLGKSGRLVVGFFKAADLVSLPGVDDLRVFDPNVRLGLGKTRINKELADTIRDRAEHTFFPAYHNGLTLLTKSFEVHGSTIKLAGVAVVNGCQSMRALYENRDRLTPGLRLLTKIVEVGDRPDLVQMITYTTNNQNPINIRDLRSNDRIQRDLQKQVEGIYGDRLVYLIKQGEGAKHAALDNRRAAQIILALWLQEPWNAVRKVRLFDERYHDIFRRVDAHKLLLCHLLDETVEALRSKLRQDLAASFASIRFTLIYLIGEVIRLTPQGSRFLAEPGLWLPHKEGEVRERLTSIAEDVVESVNHYVESQRTEEDEEAPFDPKIAFKSISGVKGLKLDVVRYASRSARRFPDVLFDISSS